MKPALLVIDMQKAYHVGNGANSMDRAAEYINAALDLFRARNLPVVWIYDKDEEDGVVPGSPGFELMDGLKPAAGEKIVHKDYSNAFNKTDLADFLMKNSVDTPILTGYSAEFCVLSTYRSARDHDLTPVLLKNAIASATQENLVFVERISDILTYNVLKKLLE